MVVSLKDSIKLLGIIVISFCAVFVCTFFLNFYLDALEIENLVTEQTRAMYEAQLATAEFTCAISGSVLAAIAIVMLVFYIKLYIDSHLKQIGILKAIGYSNGKIAARFWVFGIGVFIGATLGFASGYAAMPMIYKSLLIDGLPQIEIGFHLVLPLVLIVAPTAVFSAISCGYAYFALRRPVSSMLRGQVRFKPEKQKSKTATKNKEHSFLFVMCFKTLGGKKSLAFFVAFACFSYSAMVQMGCSMKRLSTGFMGIMILIIGVVLAVVSLFMALTSLIKANAKNIAIMRAFGYKMKECALAMLFCYVPFALIGFSIGTVYQFVLLSLMVNIVYKDVASVPDYSFSVPVFFITLASFLILYTAAMAIYTYKMSKISVKEVMAEN
ncbi:MAG: FtsX-like permease family protein [Clostridia bacterium]|nr:FtsX-like permease family protein [Clostridia bacterium]